MSTQPKKPCCYSCGKPLALDPGAFVGRRDSCPHCARDLHVCYNCKHYDKKSYNECREPQAERVVEKDRSNFCDYFVLGRIDTREQGAGKDAILKQLDDLFRK